MINILVGLIFEAYGRIRSAAGEPETLLEQVGEAVENLKDPSEVATFSQTFKEPSEGCSKSPKVVPLRYES